MQRNHWWRDYTELAILYFIQAMAMAAWFVPLGSVLRANGLEHLIAPAFGASGISAFISPLIFGALADQRYSPVKILRGLALCTSISMALASTAIGQKWGYWPTLLLIQLHSLCSAPTFGISTTIILGRLSDPKREFGPIRSTATLGWMVGCWAISWFGFDGSASAGYTGCLMWLAVVVFTLKIPSVDPPPPAAPLTWKQRLGLDALGLLKNADTRAVFIGAALYNMPLCAFYPYTPLHMADVGLDNTTAWMTLGQITEIIAMLGLAALLSYWRLKWVFLAGMTFGVLRFVACAVGGQFWLLTGVFLHGFAFTLYFITAQIFLEQRIPPAWRGRAQALLTLMLGGVGQIIGYHACGAWKAGNTHQHIVNWPVFWWGLAGAVAVIWVWFFVSYRGRPGVSPAIPPDQPLPQGTPAAPQ